MEENNTSVKEMEAASIAWVLEQFHIPFLALKVVTDIGKFRVFYSQAIRSSESLVVSLSGRRATDE